MADAIERLRSGCRANATSAVEPSMTRALGAVTSGGGRGAARDRRDDEHQHGGEQRRQDAGAHRRSLIFCPTDSVWSSRLGLSSWIWESGTWVFTAMEDGVSPGLTL